MQPIEPTKEVRRGLWERIKGKTKKVAGAATGSEGLIASGELHEVAADKHMEAAERKAQADELREAATERFFETQEELEQERAKVRAEEEIREEAVERAAAKRKTAAQERGQKRTQAVVKHATSQRDAADRKEKQAVGAQKQAQERAGARRATARGRREAAAALENVKREVEKED
jgi:uncharacterized protein YjbJ (UPF0337 family)